jgi:DNA-binding NtrC family response regulator
VRELQHCIERVAAMQPGGVIDAVHLGPVCSLHASADASVSDAPAVELGYQEARASFEQSYLKGLLEAAGGNVSEAARLSGIPRQNLYVRMKRWGFVTD